MRDSDFADFGLMMDGLAEVFSAQLSSTRKMAYWDALEDLTLDEVCGACTKAMRCEQFFPVPATLRKLAGADTEPLSPAEAAWQRLRNLSSRYNREALSDPITREVFEAMGGGYKLDWGFGNWPLDQEDRKRREFLNRYREAQSARALAPRQQPALLAIGD